MHTMFVLRSVCFVGVFFIWEGGEGGGGVVSLFDLFGLVYVCTQSL